MLNRAELAKELAHFTSLVLSVRDGDHSLREFIDAYDNFYYRYALDGHEDDTEGLQALEDEQEAIEFHRRVQTEALNPLYLAGDLDKASLERAGRIDGEEAKRRLEALCEELRAQEILRELGD